MSSDFNPLLALEVLIQHEVEFAVIGGIAGRLLGSPTITNDLDICYSRTNENLERLSEALRELGATLRGAPPDLPFQLDARTLRAGDAFTFDTTAGALDCLGTPAGVGGFEELAANSDLFDIDGFTVRVVSIDDLMRMKRAAGRPKDRIELEVLGALREEIE